MKIAVLTLTRDRVAYTQHCFAKLEENAGCDYDHYVLDQGSTDGTPDWLQATYGRTIRVRDNLGISAGMNVLLELCGVDNYDVIVKFDNDCELLTPNTLRDIAHVVHRESDLLLSPRIHGLNNPPPVIGTRGDVDEIQQIGGIFLAAPAALYADFRYDETNPVWGMDDSQACAHWRSQSGWCGYLRGYDANHYETTKGQWDRFPDYFARTRAEGKARL